MPEQGLVGELRKEPVLGVHGAIEDTQFLEGTEDFRSSPLPIGKVHASIVTSHRMGRVTLGGATAGVAATGSRTRHLATASATTRKSSSPGTISSPAGDPAASDRMERTDDNAGWRNGSVGGAVDLSDMNEATTRRWERGLQAYRQYGCRLSHVRLCTVRAPPARVA